MHSVSLVTIPLYLGVTWVGVPQETECGSVAGVSVGSSGLAWGSWSRKGSGKASYQNEAGVGLVCVIFLRPAAQLHRKEQGSQRDSQRGRRQLDRDEDTGREWSVPPEAATRS